MDLSSASDPTTPDYLGCSSPEISFTFGWAGTPAAFEVVTRAITWELHHSLQSDVMMYVDDIIGVGMANHIQTDLDLTRTVCTSLLGPSAVVDDKTEQGRRLDVIGYMIDLDTNDPGRTCSVHYTISLPSTTTAQ